VITIKTVKQLKKQVKKRIQTNKSKKKTTLKDNKQILKDAS